MSNVKLDFDPLARAESIMAKEAYSGEWSGVSHERREQIRDLIALSQAQSLNVIASFLNGDAFLEVVSGDVVGQTLVLFRTATKD